ncbi:hypothetical protein NHG29_01915 [Aerococcaceae bacterium NML160702]|nr:hypothetical protein [Aerococcaceae bacterium NML160702]
MEFNLFIIPVTMIVTELAKQYIPTKYVPLFAVIFGLLAGVGFGVYYQADLFTHAVQGLIYGASATGLYRVGQKVNEVA